MAQPTEREGIRRTSSRRGLWIIIGVVVIVAVLLSVAVLAGWFGSSGTTLLGAGATFPYPLISKWSVEYDKQTGVQVNYQSIGSGGGITQVTAKTVDFGASDMPLKPADLAAKGLIQFPPVIGGEVMVVNLSGILSGQLTLDGPTITQLSLCKISH